MDMIFDVLEVLGRIGIYTLGILAAIVVGYLIFPLALGILVLSIPVGILYILFRTIFSGSFEKSKKERS